MPRLKRMGMNIHQLRQVFELENEEESKNFTQCHPARPLMYHLLFTFAIITATSILGIIVEHERKINTQLWSNLLQMFKEIIFEESSVLRFWKSQSSGEQAFACLTLIHFAVYLAWDIRWKSSIMSNYFIINEDKSNSIWAHLFCPFSHISVLNLIINTVYLYSLCTSGFIKTWPYVLTGMSGNRFLHYMCIEEFFVFYISACVFSSLSKVYMERKFNTVSKNKHGAFGAISTIFGYIAWACPDQLLKIPFFESSLKINTLEAFLCLLFLVIVIDIKQNHNWSNTMTIITGSVFGIFWYTFLSKYLWGNRKLVTNKWITIKNIGLQFCRQLFKCGNSKVQ